VKKVCLKKEVKKLFVTVVVVPPFNKLTIPSSKKHYKIMITAPHQLSRFNQPDSKEMLGQRATGEWLIV
jgi:hypothetical protein